MALVAAMNVISFCLLLSFIACTGCAADLHTNVPLVWKPTNDVYLANSPDLSPLYSRKIQVKHFTDNRDLKQEIGKCVEDGANMPVTTNEDVARWATERFRHVLQQYGVSTADKDADIILGAELLHFYVTEDKTYKGNVGLKVMAQNRSGDLIWQGLTTGTAKRFGRSYKLENYYEVLSDAYSEAVANLLKNQSFSAALNN